MYNDDRVVNVSLILTVSLMVSLLVYNKGRALTGLSFIGFDPNNFEKTEYKMLFRTGCCEHKSITSYVRDPLKDPGRFMSLEDVMGNTSVYCTHVLHRYVILC